ncbi:substrate-binding domain-containing protein [Amycolatopsis acidiphila]|uniref:Substrate-binding domain-containing protein n=1 Tax=Amycolatopsis acidiphila TaxID=715473 RepID=A0A558AJ65_9PSEU|nr:substrate-binding domain-containing protein [Amycolatopsis acidiphila]TVT24312.1 substrate-binding domain-containing protein [Amycolatopsis acidiphila]UIJ62555.1 substrate-binding domain-containing protein [Amycolatopsis acidiphila]GHG85394.1 rhamnose ABC transporter substrate-binding protein [Amycolatopsis acidiphila]
MTARRTALAAALALALLGACAPAASTGASAPKSIRDCNLTMIPKSTDNPYFAAVHTGMADAQRELGGDLSFVGPAAGDVTGQIQRIQSGRQRGSCVIGLSAVDSTAVAPALNAARDHGAKIMAWDGDVATGSRGIFVNMARTDAIGRAQFDILANAMHRTGQFGIVSSQATAEVTNKWIAAMHAELARPENKGMTLVKTSYGDDDAKKSYDAAVALIRAYPDLRGIMAPTPIALEAGVKAATDLGVADRIVVTGLGNPSADAQLLRNGQVPAYVLWSPRELGYLAYYAAAAYISGEITGRQGESFSAGHLGRRTVGADGEIVLGDPITFTKDNVDDYTRDFQTTD